MSRSSAEQQLRQQHALPARQARRRLVQHQDSRLGSQGHGEGDLPVLAVGEIAHGGTELVVDGHAARRFARLVAHLPVPLPRGHGSQVTTLDADDRQIDVVLDAEPGEQARLLVRAGEPEPGP